MSRDHGHHDESGDEIGREQAYVSMLYDRLDDLRAQAAARRAEQLRATGGTHQARSQRDSLIGMYADQIRVLDAVENGLCFGRLDFSDGGPRYIGRIGMFGERPASDPDADDEPLLVDWRAPAARPFYLATAAAPDGVRRRRHIRTRHRKVTGLDDEVLDLAAAPRTGRDALTGEATLLAALDAERTGRMRDIVQTIQAEQDRVIRAPIAGTLVVQGGPGTGKTAVALHRAAYLLYTYRQQLDTRGVLIVGPNPTFLRYISQVLPTLAETGVLLRTLGELYPGVVARRDEPAAAAALKGRPEMVEILAAAVRDRQELPAGVREIPVDQDVLTLDPGTVAVARERARRSGKPHNLARTVFDVEIVHALADQIAERIGADPLGGENLLDEADRAEIRRELREEPEVRAVLDELWPVLTPQRLLADLFAADAADAGDAKDDADAADAADVKDVKDIKDAEEDAGGGSRLAVAAPELTAEQRRLLRRERGSGWTPADIPLLDEAAELLGEDDRAARARVARIRQEQLAYAEGVIDITLGSRSIDLEDEEEGEILSVADLLDAERLAQRHEQEEWLTTAERAAADRRWAFGHVIVDEAQELSPMAWRLLMRRCPSRSMTIVGDVAQTGALAGTASWRDALAPYVADRWRLAELTVSYRTPAEIMALAGEVLTRIDPALRPPRPVRWTGVEPWRLRVAPGALAAEVVAATLREATEVGDGRVGVLVPDGLAAELGPAVLAAVPEAAVGEEPNLETRVVLLTVRQAKGLEFDSVIVVDPDRMVAESPRGHSDLYVALTRATRRLGLLHPSP